MSFEDPQLPRRQPKAVTRPFGAIPDDALPEALPADSDEAFARTPRQGSDWGSEDPPLPGSRVAVVWPPHPSFWWALLWCLAYLIVTQVCTTILVVMAVLVLQVMRAGGLDELLGGPGTTAGTNSLAEEVLLPTILLSQVFSIAMSLLVLRLVVGREWRRQVALRAPAALHLLLILVGFPALLVLGNGVAQAAKDNLPSFDDLGIGSAETAIKGLNGAPLFLLVLAIGVGPGIGEELFCRGFLGRGLVGCHGVLGGVLLTSFLFGLIHIDPPQAVAAMVLGIVLHLTYLATRSLWVPMLLHFLNNSLAVLVLTRPDQVKALAALDKPGVLDAVMLFGIPVGVALIYLAAALLFLAVGWALYRSRAVVVATDEGPGWQPPNPGVVCPPPERGAAVDWTWPGWMALGLVVVAFAWFLAVMLVVLL